MDAVLLGLLTLALCLFLRVWASMRKSLRYWEERGVFSPETLPFVGNWLPVFLNRTGQGDYYTELYRRHKDLRTVGVYSFTRPMLVLNDPSYVEKVLVKDFSHFTDRGFEFDVSSSPIDDGILVKKGNRWRAMRNKLSPAFTSGKLKTMFGEAVKCAENLIKFVSSRTNEDHELKSLMSVYSSDVIGSCVFGVDLGSGLTPESEFVAKARRVFLMSPWRMVKFFLSTSVPALKRVVPVTLTAPDVGEFFGDILRKTVAARKASGAVRNDFLQMLFQLRDQGSIKVQGRDPDDDYLGIDQEEPDLQEEFNDDTLIAQAYTFLAAGFDTTSTALEYTLFELARHPEIQDKVRAEVKSVLEKEGQLTYQSLMEMPYLEKVIKETLRLYPAISFIMRQCTKEYTLDTGLVIEEGQLVIFPCYGFHTDPEFYPEPEQFRPERFEVEPQKGTYLPFGAGPRMCIGMRFAQVNVKIGLVHILNSFKVEPSSRTILPVKFDPRSFANAPLNPLWCKLSKITA